MVEFNFLISQRFSGLSMFLRAKNIILTAIGLCIMSMTVFALPDGSKASQDERQWNKQVRVIYNSIDFKNVDRLPFYVFEKAYRGYYNLKSEGRLNAENETLTVCDFDLPSTENRMWIIDLATHKVLFNTYVAHGQGTGEDCAEKFSNKFNSHQSSVGFYVTGDTYNGEHGLSLRLEGVDEGFNSAARPRGIVVHGASYVNEDFVTGNIRLGRSWGCPAVPDKLKIPIINAIQGGTCLFIYFPQKDYLEKSYWLNKNPQDNAVNLLSTMQLPIEPGKVKYIVEYTHGSTVDSTKTFYK